MSNSIILILTNKVDAHSDDMINYLYSVNQNPIRLNSDDFPRNVDIHLNVGAYGASDIVIRTNNYAITGGEIKSVWWRRPNGFLFPSQLEQQELEFAKDETKAMLYGYLYSLQCYFMNHPGATQQADMKLEQLSRAKKLGFQIPDTLVTNNSELVMDFYDKHDGEIIYKVMSSGILAHNKVEKSVFDIPHAVYTTPISDKELAMISSVEHVPCLFQEYVPKKREYRVTIVESDVFVVAIDTQEDEKARIDWRHNNLSSQYSLGSLPIEISSKCIELTKNYGLNFSAIDLIETPQGEFIFLEINPNGQFMFLEKFLPELRITEAVANCLIRG